MFLLRPFLLRGSSSWCLQPAVEARVRNGHFVSIMKYVTVHWIIAELLLSHGLKDIP